MMYRLLLIWCCLAMPAFGGPVAVTSGEHAGFTRLVLDFGAPVDWQVGRTSDGYALQLRGKSPPQPYDLTKVFALIGKGRLAAIWADPQTVQLNIGVACACHAIPFEFRPGILVIDLRDGAPPKGSSFELALDGASVPMLDVKPTPRPRARPDHIGPIYDWTKRALADLKAPLAAVDLPQHTADFGDPTLQSLRESLLHQLSRGAALGVVDLTLPVAKSATAKPADGLIAARIALGELPGVAMANGLPIHQDIAAQGQACPSAERLALSGWGSDSPISQQMSDQMIGLIQEFDHADPTAVENAVKFNLFLGFGIESRKLFQAFPVELPDQPLFSSLSYILDQDPDPAPAFSGLAACDTPAALWAVLSDPAPVAGDVVNINAVLRAFSELPVHLRRHLGPDLAQRFLAISDPKTAMTIRNAIARAPGQAGPKLGLLEAQISMAQGDPAAAESRIEMLLADPGPETAIALVALTEARVAQNLPVTPEVVSALDAILADQAGPDQTATRRALLLAQAASGDFDSAFAGLAERPDLEPDLWRLLAEIGTDQAVLAHAVTLPDVKLSTDDLETNAVLASRLLGLGLPDQALRWLDQADDPDSLLLAQVHLARSDGQAALAALASLPDDIAAPLRAIALQIQGDEVAAAETYAAIGDTDGERRASARARDWLRMANLSPSDWGAVVERLQPLFVDANPLLQPASLARGRQIAESASQTRTEINALLASIAAP